MRKDKIENIRIHFTKQLPYVLVNEQGQKCRYAIQMYSGKIKYRLKEFDQFIPVNAYGLNILIFTDVTKEPTSYDFGYLSSEGYQVGALIHALGEAKIKDFDHLRKAIRSAALAWGQPVYDLYGEPVYAEGGKVKRDPFVIAAKRVLKGLLAKTRKSIANATNSTPPKNGKGVDL